MVYLGFVVEYNPAMIAKSDCGMPKDIESRAEHSSPLNMGCVVEIACGTGFSLTCRDQARCQGELTENPTLQAVVQNVG
jgi:hypothetical protein